MTDRENSFGNVLVKQSATEGFGIYAQEAFEAGDVIRTRIIVRELTAQNPLRASERSDHVANIDDKLFLIGEPDCYLNHSCDPNAYLQYKTLVPELVARRPIEVGDQISLDYLINNSGGNSWTCSCGAKRCRGMTGTSYFELPAEFQVDYDPLLADWFRKRYADRLASAAK